MAIGTMESKAYQRERRNDKVNTPDHYQGLMAYQKTGSRKRKRGVTNE